MKFELTELQKKEIYLGALNEELRKNLNEWNELRKRERRTVSDPVEFVECPNCWQAFMKDWNSDHLAKLRLEKEENARGSDPHPQN